MAEQPAPSPSEKGVRFSTEDLAAHALQTFPPRGDDLEAARQYAQRLVSREHARRRAAGEPTDTEADQALRRVLDAALERLAPHMQGGRTGWWRALGLRRRRPPVQAGVDEAHLERIIARAFAAPTDGSRRRARVLAGRARGEVKRTLREARVGWLAAWRLRRRATAMIRAQMANIVDGGK